MRLKAEGRGSGDGAEVLNELRRRLGTGGLFGGGSLMVVAGAGRLGRTKDLRASLNDTLANMAPGNGVVLVDQRARRPNLKGMRPDGPGELGLLVQDRGGSIVSCISPGPGELASWLLARAKSAGREIAGDAAKSIAERLGAEVREPDLDRSGIRMTAAVELEKLMLAIPTGPISLRAVDALVADRGVGSLFAFADAIVSRSGTLVSSTSYVRLVSQGQWSWRHCIARCATSRRFTARPLLRVRQLLLQHARSACTSSPPASLPKRRASGAAPRSPTR